MRRLVDWADGWMLVGWLRLGNLRLECTGTSSSKKRGGLNRLRGSRSFSPTERCFDFNSLPLAMTS